MHYFDAKTKISKYFCDIIQFGKNENGVNTYSILFGVC